MNLEQIIQKIGRTYGDSPCYSDQGEMHFISKPAPIRFAFATFFQKPDKVHFQLKLKVELEIGKKLLSVPMPNLFSWISDGEHAYVRVIPLIRYQKFSNRDAVAVVDGNLPMLSFLLSGCDMSTLEALTMVDTDIVNG